MTLHSTNVPGRRPGINKSMLTRIPRERLADILDIAEDGVVVIDGRQRIVLFNRGAANLFGYAPEEVAGRPLDLLIPPRFHEAHRRDVDAFGRAGEPARLMGQRQEVFGRRKDGSEFPAEVSISKFQTRGELLLTAIVRDVTERRRFEAARAEVEQFRARVELEDTRAKLGAVVQSAWDAIVILDGGGRVTFFNPAAEQLFAVAPEAAVGRPVARLLGSGFVVPAALDAAPEPLVEVTVEVGGRLVPLEVSQSRVYDGGRSVWLLIIRDVTERKRNEEALRQLAAERERALIELRAKTEDLRGATQQLWWAARLAAVGELAAGIAHELNNPLATVSLRVEGVLAETPADDPRRRPLEVVEQEVERMANLVANLLNFSPPSRDVTSTTDVCEEITRAVELIEHHLPRHRIRVETDFAPELPSIQADRQ
jgi:PAS domain S-box-containing protein